ncbi:MAG: GNAT family N-acetyltransferase [Desulfobacteraceae bacterium]|nr:GNAT family N-acetyltransferase [Desulfobacteraceae bacterium]
MGRDFDIEIINNWEQTRSLASEWNALHKRSEVEHPFATYEWFDCWYRAFCKPGNERIIIVRDGISIRAIFPGMLIKLKKYGITFNTFSYAANGHSPRCGIIAPKNDTESVRVAIASPITILKKKIDFISLPSINSDSSTYNVVMQNKFPHLQLYIEHTFESPSFDISGGMDSYLATRSRNFRKRIKQSLNRANRLGRVEYDIVKNMENSNDIVKRLKSLDHKTWQHQNGTGLFSTTENSKFYSSLIHDYSERKTMIVCFLKIGGVDAAYEVATFSGPTAFFLKYGYDPAFNKCRPGLLIQTYLSSYSSSLGLKEVDLLGETTTEKARWATHSRKHSNFWLINRKTLNGIGLVILLKIYENYKKIFKYKDGC